MLFLFLLLPITCCLLPSRALAVVDPLAVTNNRLGIHIISASPEEASTAAQLVNSSGGDWGYVTVIMKSGDRNLDKWQNFFDYLRLHHLIPLVRLATEPDGDRWKVPDGSEAQAWADFLDKLIWPVKNRYVIIYNEPNYGQEWGGSADAAAYAKTLDQTITALKNKSPDFFVLNAGLDASSPQKPPDFEDEVQFLTQMNNAVPGIFNKLDGWASHSYPNPGFVGSPDASGRGTVRTFEWELSVLRNLGVNKTLPVFITETGWKHAEGQTYDNSLPTADQAAGYLEEALRTAWNDPRIAAVTPFVLNYQEPPFDHFSFKRITGEGQSEKILGAAFPDYYSMFQTMSDFPKAAGQPVQENKAEVAKNNFYPTLVSGQYYILPMNFRNTGESVWNENAPISLRVLSGKEDMGIEKIQPFSDEKVQPRNDASFNIFLRPNKYGKVKVTLQLFSGDKPFDQPPLEFISDIKPPVLLDLQADLGWKIDPGGQYFLSVESPDVNTTVTADLSSSGRSQPLEARYLLPDSSFKFILRKPFYMPKEITMKVQSGENKLDFGTLNPDLSAMLTDPPELLRLLPFVH